MCCAKMLPCAFMFLFIYSFILCCHVFHIAKNCDQWKLFFSMLSLDDGMVVTPVRCAAGNGSRDVSEERCCVDSTSCILGQV